MEDHLLIGAATEPACRDSSGPESVSTGFSLPGYEILEELGRGNMGVVYKARHLGLNRLIALKMIRSGELASEADRLRFRVEAEALARLQHANIVQIHDVGDHAGLPYFALEYVEGGSLDRWLAGTPQPPLSAAAKVEMLARAVQEAHAQGIVHRDLKPGNVLLGKDQILKITDFGLARLAGATSQTQTGAILGTPSYMAPEQARGEGRAVGPATDVYALGAILYEMLTGRPPFKGTTLHDTLLQVISDEPVPPRQLQPGVPRDLETICLKCLQKDAVRRYLSAADLAEDLRRFQAGEPIAARPIGRLGRGWRWCRRNPAVASLLTAVAAALLLGIAFSSLFALRAEERRTDAETAQKQADLFASRAEERRIDAEKAQKQAEYEKELARQQLELAKRHLMTVQLLRLGAILEKDPELARELLHDDTVCPPALRDFTWRLFDSRCNNWGYQRAEWLLGKPITATALSPDGFTLAISCGNEGIGLVDLRTGDRTGTVGGDKGGTTCLTFSADGKLLVSAGVDKLVRIWNTGTWTEIAAFKGLPDEIGAVALSVDGKDLAVGCRDGEVILRKLFPAGEALRLKAHLSEVTCLQFSPDGTTLATGSKDQTVKLWNVATRQLRNTLKGHDHAVSHLAFSHDGKCLASSSERTLKIWDPKKGEEQATLQGTIFDDFQSVTFLRTTRMLVTMSDKRELVVWDLATKQPQTLCKGEDLAVAAAAGGSGNSVIVSVARGRLLWFDLGKSFTHSFQVGNGQPGAVAVAPGGKIVASVRDPDAVSLWDVATGAAIGHLKGHKAQPSVLRFSADDKLLAWGMRNGDIQLWDVASRKLLATLEGKPEMISCLSFSPDSSLLISGSGEPVGEPKPGTIVLWDLASKSKRAEFLGHSSEVIGVAVSPDGNSLASIGWPDELKLRDITTQRELATVEPKMGQLRSVAYSPDGATLALASMDGFVILLDAKTGSTRQTLRGHVKSADMIAFSPDGKNLATSGVDKTVRLWDVATGQERETLAGPDEAIHSLGFSPDGSSLHCAGINGAIRVWDASPSNKKGFRLMRKTFQSVARHL